MAQYDVRTWYGLLAPSATPRPILNKLSASVLDVLKMPDVHKKLRAGHQPDPARARAVRCHDQDRGRAVLEDHQDRQHQAGRVR
ncbi:tripartite tricarboxylate transporter substrate-binding protein [Limnohabitans sp. Rim8]|uniref:tripartite tricarboxylate transporter substrate-binding protein n=1 Tax=Limnohabitans sp. Rim8 TaxID=1100718 RepID=UPI0033057576